MRIQGYDNRWPLALRWIENGHIVGNGLDPLATYNSTLLPVHFSIANDVTVEYALPCRDHRLKLNDRLVHVAVHFVRPLP